MSGRAVLSEVGSGHTLEVKTTDVTVTRQAHFDSSKTTSPLATAVVRASLANHILVSHTTSPVAVMVRPPVVAPAQGGSVAVVSAAGSSAVTGSVGLAGRVPSSIAAASADTVRQSNSTGVVCIMPVALTNVRVSGSAPITRLPTPGTDVRLPLQMLQAPRTSSTERSKLSVTATSFQPRPAMVGHAAHPTPSPLAAAVAATGMRALLPINSNRPVALPIVRPPTVSIPGLSSWGSSVPATSSSAPTIQIAIRPSQTDTAAGQPAATVTSVASTPLQLRMQPERMILAAVTSADACASGVGSQTQAINLVSKTKILLTHSSLQQKVSPSLTSSHLSGVQPVALNLSQSARGRAPVLPYVIPSALPAQSSASTVPAKQGTTSGVSAQAQISAINFVTIARPVLSNQAQPSVAQPRYKSVSATISSSSVPLQSPSQGGTLLLGGNCNILTSGAVLSVEGFSERAAQQSDRSTQILQPVQRDYAAQILTVPTGTRIMYDQPQPTPVSVVGQANRPTLVVSQHSSALLNTSGKVAQVVVAMDSTRRAVQSAYVVDGGSLSVATQPTAEPTSTASQTMMSPRPSILRKRPHDVTPKKTNLLHVITAGVESGTGSHVRTHAVTSTVTASPFRPVDSSRDNSQSSTDTASFSGSTQGSCPPSAEKVKLEPMEIVENGVMSNGQIDVPRKKPRKQLLHANEEILPMPGFSSFGDDEVVHTESSDHHVSRQKLRKQLEKVTDDSLHQGQEIAEFCDEDGVRFSMEDSRRRFPGGIVGSLHFGWKSRNNHFVSYNDLVTKEERRASVNELANSRRAHLRSSGWPVHYFADQLEQLRESECDVLDRLKASVPEEASDVHQSINCNTADDDGLHAVRELVLGNIQRCQQFVARLDEAHTTLLSITETHKQRVADIISRHQSKRIVKKKERL